MATPKPIFPSSMPTATITTPETTAGKNFLKLFAIRPITASQAPANITIPQTTGRPKVAAADMAEGR